VWIVLVREQSRLTALIHCRRLHPEIMLCGHWVSSGPCCTGREYAAFVLKENNGRVILSGTYTVVGQHRSQNDTINCAQCCNSLVFEKVLPELMCMHICVCVYMSFSLIPDIHSNCWFAVWWMTAT